MGCYAKACALDEAQECFLRMQQQDIVPTVIEYNQLLHIFARKQQPQWAAESEALFRDMIDKRVTPTHITLSILNRTLGQARLASLCNALSPAAQFLVGVR